MKTLRHLYLINSDVHFLNHGSYGATPKPVFEAYQAWQLRAERQPVQFYGRELFGHMERARDALAAYVGANRDDLVYVPNATHAANVVARSLGLETGDEILTTNHEYGACVNAFEYAASRQGATVVRQPLSFPLVNNEALIDQFWKGVTDKTRAIFLSHITSATALMLPVREICARAREAGIVTAIDGAHAPGQIDLDLDQIDADFYFGNAHKWLCAPKGAAFLFARKSIQEVVEPLVVGWGWGPQQGHDLGSTFLNGQQFLGTNDLAAYLSVPDAITFQAEQNWPSWRDSCHRLLTETMSTIENAFDLQSPYPDDSYYAQMAVAPIPNHVDVRDLHDKLLERYNVEIPVMDWNGHKHVRISAQAYNGQSDMNALVDGLLAEIA